MYLRIKNRLDAKMLLIDLNKDEKNNEIASRIAELAGTLDDNYGSLRPSYGMGGYILFFPDVLTYQREISEIMDFYGLDPALYEYKEIVGEKSDSRWVEELYLLSSEDSLVLIYPRKEV